MTYTTDLTRQRQAADIAAAAIELHEMANKLVMQASGAESFADLDTDPTQWHPELKRSLGLATHAAVLAREAADHAMRLANKQVGHLVERQREEEAERQPSQIGNPFAELTSVEQRNEFMAQASEQWCATHPGRDGDHRTPYELFNAGIFTEHNFWVAVGTPAHMAAANSAWETRHPVDTRAGQIPPLQMHLRGVYTLDEFWEAVAE